MVKKQLLWVCVLITLGIIFKPSTIQILSSEQMTAIFVDLHLAKGLVLLQEEEQAAPSVFMSYVPAICEAHKTDYDTFYRSTQYYIVHRPQKLADIYNAVVQELAQLETPIE